jgi:hypothetical protein
MEPILLSSTFRCFSCSPGLVADERKVLVENIYAPGVHVLTNNLLPCPEGKISAVRSLKVPEFDKGNRGIGIANQ